MYLNFELELQITMKWSRVSLLQVDNLERCGLFVCGHRACHCCCNATYCCINLCYSKDTVSVWENLPSDGCDFHSLFQLLFTQHGDCIYAQIHWHQLRLI